MGRRIPAVELFSAYVDDFAAIGDVHVEEAFFAKADRKLLSRFDLPMYQANLLCLAYEGAEIGEQVVVIGVTGKAAAADHLGAERDHAIEDAHFRTMFGETPAKRLGCLIAREEHGRPRI